jgi:hypothetical protein
MECLACGDPLSPVPAIWESAPGCCDRRWHRLVSFYNCRFGIDGDGSGNLSRYQSVGCLRKNDWAALPGVWRKGAIVAGVWLLLSLPLIIGAFQGVYGQHVPLESGGEFWSNDLLTFVTPSPLWGPGQFPDGPGSSHLAIGSILGTGYLGITPLLLGGIALCSVRRTDEKAIFWGAVFLFFAILSWTIPVCRGQSVVLRPGRILFRPLPAQVVDHVPSSGTEG